MFTDILGFAGEFSPFGQPEARGSRSTPPSGGSWLRDPARTTKRIGAATRWRSYDRSIRRSRPDDSLILFLNGAEALVHESLNTLSFVGLGRVDVAFGVGRDAVDPEELSRLTATVAETCEELQRLPVENVDLGILAVGQVDESL